MTQKPDPKIRVAVLYGGRSGEHEVSLLSAASVIRNLDRSRFDVVPIAIDKEGRWHLNDIKLIEASLQKKALPLLSDGSTEVLLPAQPATNAKAAPGELRVVNSNGGVVLSSSLPGIDVIFPVMHGTLCEDGTIQGFLELTGLPYVGSGVLGSAVGMDKEFAKRLARDSGIPIVPFLVERKVGWQGRLGGLKNRVASDLGFPCFVKPANSGSSVGVHKVKAPEQLEAAMRDAFSYDTKILIEKAIDAREIEFSVLENPNDPSLPKVSLPGEIIPKHEFYSYEAKYLDENGAGLEIPAKLNTQQIAMGQEIAGAAFQALECEGMARVDLFLDRKSGQFYFNEVNTIPGFTQISMYPKMWEASGLPYQELLSRLIELALLRRDRRAELKRDFSSDIDEIKG